MKTDYSVMQNCRFDSDSILEKNMILILILKIITAIVYVTIVVMLMLSFSA